MGKRLQKKISSLEKILLGLVLLLLASVLNYSHLTQKLDHAIYDFHLSFWSRDKPEDIILVIIDDQSIDQLGRWPWSRQTYAKLLDNLKEAKAVGFNILFSEADKNDPEGDKLLAESIAEHGSVVLPVSPVLISERNGKVLKELSSLPMFNKAATGLGHVDIELDNDSISRSIFLKGGIGQSDRSALPLAMIERLGVYDLNGEKNRHYDVENKNQISWVRDQRVLLPFSGKMEFFRKVSFIDVISKNIDLSIFKGKWVLVGIDATGLGDRFSIPTENVVRSISGVEYEAQVLDILLRNKGIKPLTDNQNFLLTIPFIILLVVLANLFGSNRLWISGAIPIAATLIVCIGFSSSEIIAQHIWFRPGSALVTLISGLLWLYRQNLVSLISSLHKEKHSVQMTMNTINDAVIIADNHGCIEFMNSQAEVLTDFQLKDAKGKGLNDIVTIESHEGRHYSLEQVVNNMVLNQIIGQTSYRQPIKTKVKLPENLFLKQNNGQLLSLWATVGALINEANDIIGAVIAFNIVDKSESKTNKNLIDSLTQLPGLPIVHDRLSNAILNAERTQRLICVLYIDIIKFSSIHGGLGNKNADMVLEEVARRISTRSRTGDTVARVGEDEFVVILENLEDVTSVASLVTSLLKEINKPIQLQVRQLSVEASIGISAYPKDGHDADILIKSASTAMKRARKNHRTNSPCFHFYSKDINALARKQLLSEEDLRYALSHKNFELYYQPRVDFKTGKIVAVEALIRWLRPGQGLIMPTSFIPLAERSGLINEIGSWVIHTACEQAKEWESTNLLQPRMAINLSPRQFLQQDLLETITQILNKSDLEPRFLELEITENSLIKDADRCIEILKEFRSLGGSVAIDDFGTGYSSLSYLKNFPVDTLKVDKVFVQDITTEPDHAAITMAVISMAHSLNLRVVAEGVEDKAQFEYLRANGCDELQGYYFCKPLSAKDMTQMLVEKRSLQLDEVHDNFINSILLVDDDSEILSYLSTTLRHEGYQILMANCAEEALDLLARHTVGVVICDEIMPSINGGELLRKIKCLYPKTTRMLMSASADRAAIIAAINSGAIFKFLEKPISETLLKDSIREGFEIHRKNEEPPKEYGFL